MIGMEFKEGKKKKSKSLIRNNAKVKYSNKNRFLQDQYDFEMLAEMK